MEKYPEITLITVCFNSVLDLENTFIKTLDLKYNNLRYIVIDGNSKDDTLELLKRYEEKFEQKGIKYKWISEPDKGIYDAMNKGWRLATEDSYIVYLGAGDYIVELPNINEILLNDIVFGNVRLGKNRVFKSRIDYRLRFCNTIHHQALLIKKKIHIEPPFNIKYKIYADFDFNQRLLKMGYNFYYSTNFIAYALPGGISEKLNIKETIEVSKKNFGLLTSNLLYFYLIVQKIKGIFRRIKC